MAFQPGQQVQAFFISINPEQDEYWIWPGHRQEQGRGHPEPRLFLVRTLIKQLNFISLYSTSGYRCPKLRPYSFRLMGWRWTTTKTTIDSDRGSDEGNINLVRTVRLILIANFNMSVFIFSASFLELLTMAHSPPAPPCISLHLGDFDDAHCLRSVSVKNSNENICIRLYIV